MIEPVNAFVIIPSAFPAEWDVNSAVAIVDISFSDLPDMETECTVVWRNSAVMERVAADL